MTKLTKHIIEDIYSTPITYKDILFWIDRFGKKDYGIDIEELKEALSLSDIDIEKLKSSGLIVEQVAGKVKVL